MPDITIIKLKIRRGTDAQRNAVILEQGEIGYTIDTKRVFVGDGVLGGGNVVGNITHPPQLSVSNLTNLTNAIKGDIVYANSLLYQLTGSNYNLSTSWGFIGPQPDNSTLAYSGNKLIIKDGGITGVKFAASAAFNQGVLVAGTTGLSANVDNSTLIITATNQLSVNQIDQRHISSTSFGNGISGGSGSTISINSNPLYFSYNSGVLNLSNLPAGIVKFGSIDQSMIGAGLTIDGSQFVTQLQSVNGTLQNSSGVVGLPSIVGTDTAKLGDSITYDTYGRITVKSNALALSAKLLASNAGTLSTFNGYIDQVAHTNQTIVPVSGVNTGSINLTSAGYMLLDTVYGQLAIPVLKY